MEPSRLHPPYFPVLWVSSTYRWFSANYTGRAPSTLKKTKTPASLKVTTLNEVEMSENSWYNIQEGIQKLGEIVMLEFIHNE